MSEQANQPTAAGDRYSVDTGLARPGAVTYLHLPATDVRLAAAFYRDVFGWSINGPDSDRPSFNDASGLLSGAWTSDHLRAAEDDGYEALLCTYWPDVDAAWERATAAGAQVLHPLADHFYGERGGRLRDPFDQEWMLSARLEKLTAAEISARAPTHD